MNTLPAQRILEKLDGLLGKNDYPAAERHLLYWLSEAKALKDNRNELLLLNELAGLYRKLQNEEKALSAVAELLSLTQEENMENNVGTATTYVNCATVYKAFGRAKEALPIFRKAEKIYESRLSPEDERKGGLYNNMALALSDLGMYEEAYEYYDKALCVMKSSSEGELETAITYLNIATTKESQLGAEDCEGEITEYLEKAEKILDSHKKRDGHYAFVCDKCASVFGYFGFFVYEKELKERVKNIYEGA